MIIDLVDMLKTDVGDALRDLGFRKKAAQLDLQALKYAVAEQLDKLGVQVTVVNVARSAGPEAIRDFTVQWQARGAGGPYQEQYFDLSIPESGWYVERWSTDGTKSKTAWYCEPLHARELVAATIRRGEIARVMAPPGASKAEFAALSALGRVEPL